MSPPRPSRARIVRAAPALVSAALLAVLAGCANRAPTPAPATPSTTPSASPVPSTAGRPKPPPTPTAPPLPGMPVPVSSAASGVDSARIRSLDDLPAAFGCPPAVTPIRIPAAAATGTAAPAPDAVICPSSLAKGEAIYLWYCPTPQEKLAALTLALEQTKYVHAGPNWVAGGMVNPDLGSVGGEVYR